MAFRFRRSMRLLPGVRLNFSRGGVSASVGVRGATINLGKRGARATVGLPGTGLSYTTPLSGPSHPDEGAPVAARAGGGAVWVVAGLLAGILALVGLSRIGAPRAAASAPPVAAPAPAMRRLTVSPRVLNCRAAPEATAAPVRKLLRGTEVSATAQSGDWIQIAWAGAPCWVLGRYLR